jgi:hypothetical protein
MGLIQDLWEIHDLGFNEIKINAFLETSPVAITEDKWSSMWEEHTINFSYIQSHESYDGDLQYNITCHKA